MLHWIGIIECFVLYYIKYTEIHICIINIYIIFDIR